MYITPSGLRLLALFIDLAQRPVLKRSADELERGQSCVPLHFKWSTSTDSYLLSCTTHDERLGPLCLDIILPLLSKVELTTAGTHEAGVVAGLRIGSDHGGRRHPRRRYSSHLPILALKIRLSIILVCDSEVIIALPASATSRDLPLYRKY